MRRQRLGIQWQVCLALAPGGLILTWLFGTGVIVNLLVAALSCLMTEAACLTLAGRGQQIRARLSDGSAMLTAMLIALALPPGCGIGVIVVACALALGLGKHAYGGIGQNLFNPAMVGYAAVLISFPAALATWPPVASEFANGVDGLSGATILSSMTNEHGLTLSELAAGDYGVGQFGGLGVEWAALAFAASGLVLALRRTLAWRVPAGMLLALTIAGFVGFDGGSSNSLGSPMIHLFSGGTMLAAFFVATDPVTHPSSARGQWLFGLLVGLLTYLIRSYAAYPDGIAFAVLLANCATPWLNRTLARSRVGGAADA
ncbi:MAG: RnfABCDGE type electron transport complex subunit D [Pseudomonadaceae bacterium]|nr:RnfABCDGE type electron transport complex subunit D [Pseudomonadaceae bacterium]